MIQELVEYEYVLCCHKDSIMFFHSRNLMHAFAKVITITKQKMPDIGRVNFCILITFLGLYD